MEDEYDSAPKIKAIIAGFRRSDDGDEVLFPDRVGRRKEYDNEVEALKALMGVLFKARHIKAVDKQRKAGEIWAQAETAISQQYGPYFLNLRQQHLESENEKEDLRQQIRLLEQALQRRTEDGLGKEVREERERRTPSQDSNLLRAETQLVIRGRVESSARMTDSDSE